ncbi:VanZ-like domain-containing protein, partial [Dysosmobacter welbionis]
RTCGHRPPVSPPPSSYVEPEVDHVSVLNHILLALAAEQPFLLGGVDAAAGDHVIVCDDLRPDEAPLDVGVDLAGGLGGLGALLDGPGPALVLAVGQEGDQAQQSVGALDEPVQAGLLHSQLLQKHQLLLALQLGDVLLHLGADGQHLAVLRVGNGLHLLVVLVMLQIGEARLVGVGGVDHRLQGQQVGGGDQGRVVLV